MGLVWFINKIFLIHSMLLQESPTGRFVKWLTTSVASKAARTGPNALCAYIICVMCILFLFFYQHTWRTSFWRRWFLFSGSLRAIATAISVQSCAVGSCAIIVMFSKSTVSCQPFQRMTIPYTFGFSLGSSFTAATWWRIAVSIVVFPLGLICWSVADSTLSVEYQCTFWRSERLCTHVFCIYHLFPFVNDCEWSLSNCFILVLWYGTKKVRLKTSDTISWGYR